MPRNQGPALPPAKGPVIAALAARPIQKTESRRNLFSLRLSAIPCLLTCFSDHKYFRLFRISSNSYYAGSSNTAHKQQCKPQDGIARISCFRIIRVSCIIRSGSGSCILFPYSCIGYILCYGFFYLWIPSFERISFSGRCFSVKGRSRFILQNDCRLILENFFIFHAVRICYGIACLCVFYFVTTILTNLCNVACIRTVISRYPIA